MHNNSTLLIEIILIIYAKINKLSPNWERLTELFHLRVLKPRITNKYESLSLIKKNNDCLHSILSSISAKYDYQFLQYMQTLFEQALAQSNLQIAFNILRDSQGDIQNTINDVEQTTEMDQQQCELNPNYGENTIDG